MLYCISSLLLWLTLSCCMCSQEEVVKNRDEVQVGATCLNEYLPLLKGKNVALVVNQTAVVGAVHLVDTLLAAGLDIKRIFAPEHGFRGREDAGASVEDGIDKQSGLPVVSLYGKHKKPTAAMLKGIDYVVFDIQDVGVRFYTYISTLHYVMEACAEHDIPLLVLDRPNPNGHAVAGPVLDTAYRSFVGMHPIPVLHGLTVGELAGMINGEGWLSGGIACRLRVIKVKHWSHDTPYVLPVKPSPNLPNARSIALYPSLCFFEPTVVSVGRGTYFPFQVYGHPENVRDSFFFTPESIEGMSKFPKHLGKKCYGKDFREETVGSDCVEFTLAFLLEAYQQYDKKEQFFTNPDFFCLLAGNGVLIEQIKSGMSLQQIESSWREELAHYLTIRNKYLLYD